MHTAFRELPVGARQQQAHECITSKQRTEAPMGCVDCAGFARYRVFECRIIPEQEWYRRGIFAFVSYILETKAFLFVIWPDLFVQLCVAKLPQYTKYSESFAT